MRVLLAAFALLIFGCGDGKVIQKSEPTAGCSEGPVIVKGRDVFRCDSACDCEVFVYPNSTPPAPIL